MRKHGLRVLWLSMLSVLGAMAFAAAGTEANWLDATGEIITETPLIVSAHPGGSGMIVQSLNLEIKCPKIKSDPTAPVKLLAKSTISHGHLLAEECKTFTLTPFTEQKLCVPHSPGQEAGTILSGGLSHLILHPVLGGKNYMLFEPLGGLKGIFTTIEFPEVCALVETSEITGSLTAECGELNGSGVYVGGDCKTLRTTQVMKEIPRALAEDQIRFGAELGRLDGFTDLKLGGGGTLENTSWGGHI
jgi:hypothetical protein